MDEYDDDAFDAEEAEMYLQQWYTPPLCKWERLRRQRDQEAEETSQRRTQRWQKLQTSFLGSSGVWY